jgi:hypothetical protein
MCLNVEYGANATEGIRVQQLRAMCQFCLHCDVQAYCNYNHKGINCNNEYICMVHTVSANNPYYSDFVLFKARLK